MGSQAGRRRSGRPPGRTSAPGRSPGQDMARGPTPRPAGAGIALVGVDRSGGGPQPVAGWLAIPVEDELVLRTVPGAVDYLADSLVQLAPDAAATILRRL